jgi:hypothetical protein
MAYDVQHTLPRDLLEFHRLLEHWSTFGLPMVLSLSLPTRAGDEEEESRLAYIRDLLSACSRKPLVHGVVWNQLQDTPGLPSGALNEKGQPKRLLKLFNELYAQSRRKA